jgi:hypothetical protein
MNLYSDKNKIVPNFTNPPILKGIETVFEEINKRDRLKKHEKITNKIVKLNEAEKYFPMLNPNAKIIIRPPPNFLV